MKLTNDKNLTAAIKQRAEELEAKKAQASTPSEKKEGERK